MAKAPEPDPIVYLAFRKYPLPAFQRPAVRDTLALLGERVCTTPEEFKGWSQNLAHEGVLTMFISYGTVSSERQVEIMEAARRRPERGSFTGDTPD
jgi:hypothetical protein